MAWYPNAPSKPERQIYPEMRALMKPGRLQPIQFDHVSTINTRASNRKSEQQCQDDSGERGYCSQMVAQSHNPLNVTPNTISLPQMPHESERPGYQHPEKHKYVPVHPAMYAPPVAAVPTAITAMAATTPAPRKTSIRMHPHH